MNTYVALLRGINVGGHKKVPMADLKKLLSTMGYSDVQTLLNSGNVVFRCKSTPTGQLEKTLETAIEKHFGFRVPVILRSGDDFKQLVDSEPFAGTEVTKNTRLYLSFLKNEAKEIPTLPLETEDGDFRILDYTNATVISVLDLSKTKTVDGMKSLENIFGKDITTRNWNTVEKIGKLL
jgi:uncharacterized protein (DUF1697 family)